jgi:hypothetical protein|tara:strand:+ start:142 stop:351 length:210 start_codon:yes stop_codon:yes gene_type:complete
MNTTDAPSVLIYKDGELKVMSSNPFQFHDVVLFLQDGQPVTLGELEVDDDFQASILDRVFDKWYHAYVD